MHNMNNMNCSKGFVNIDLSQLPHDMTQREVVETMIRKHEISNFMYSDEDEDTTRYMIQNPDDRRTCRRPQGNNKTEIVDDLGAGKGSTSPIDLHQKILLGAKSNSIACNTTSIELDNINSNRRNEIASGSLITDEMVEKITTNMNQRLEYIDSCDQSKAKQSSNSNSHEEKRFFVYCNMLEEVSKNYPKLRNLLGIIKEGFQATIRNIVSNERKKGKQDSNKIQKQFDDRGLIIEEQEDIIESKDEIIKQMKQRINQLKDDNHNLQGCIEKQRLSGIKLQEDNERLRVDLERAQKIEEEIFER